MESREQLLAWCERWAAVNRVTEREHGACDAVGRLRILDRLYTAALAAAPCAGSHDERVWLRMQSLRHAYRADA